MVNEAPTKEELADAATDPELVVEYWAEVAGEWRVSPTSAENFEKYGTGPTKYRVVRR